MNRLKKRTQIERMTVAKTLVESVLDEVRDGVTDNISDLIALTSIIRVVTADLKVNLADKMVKENLTGDVVGEWKDG